MVCVLTVDDGLAARGRACEFDRRFDAFSAGIGEKDLIEIRCVDEEALGQDAGERRNVHLDEIRQLAVEYALEGFAQVRMVTTDREHAESAEQVEVAAALAVVQILPGAAAEACVVADRLENPHQLAVEVPAMHGIALGFPLIEQSGQVELQNTAVPGTCA